MAPSPTFRYTRRPTTANSFGSWRCHVHTCTHPLLASRDGFLQPTPFGFRCRHVLTWRPTPSYNARNGAALPMLPRDLALPRPHMASYPLLHSTQRRNTANATQRSGRPHPRLTPSIPLSTCPIPHTRSYDRLCPFRPSHTSLNHCQTRTSLPPKQVTTPCQSRLIPWPPWLATATPRVGLQPSLDMAPPFSLPRPHPPPHQGP